MVGGGQQEAQLLNGFIVREDSLHYDGGEISLVNSATFLRTFLFTPLLDHSSYLCMIWLFDDLLLRNGLEFVPQYMLSVGSARSVGVELRRGGAMTDWR